MTAVSLVHPTQKNFGPTPCPWIATLKNCKVRLYCYLPSVADLEVFVRASKYVSFVAIHSYTTSLWVTLGPSSECPKIRSTGSHSDLPNSKPYHYTADGRVWVWNIPSHTTAASGKTTCSQLVPWFCRIEAGNFNFKRI